MIEHIPEEEFVETIYACLLGELPWPSLMTRIDALLPNAISNFVMVESRGSRANVELSTNCPADAIESYNSYYHRVHPWMSKAFMQPIGMGMISDQLMPRSQSMRTEYYNDFMRPLGVTCGVGVVPVRNSEGVLLLSTLNASAEPEEMLAVADLLTRLSPHLQRAFHFYRRRAAAEAAEKEAMLTAIGVGTVLVRQGRFVRSTSEKARIMIEEGCGISISPTGRVMFSDDETSGRLDLMLKRDFTGNSVFSTMAERNGKRFRYTLLRLASDYISEFLEGPTVAVLIERNEQDRARQQDALLAAYGLTPAEARVAARLVKGETVDEVAFAHGVSRETVRTQIKSIYAKLGVSRQVDLLRLLL